MKYLELRHRLMAVLGCTRKEATLGIRWARGLETHSSVYLDQGEYRTMSQKVRRGSAVGKNIESIRDIVETVW